MRRALLLIGALLALGLGLAAGVLAVAHWRIRANRPPLPTIAELDQSVAGASSATQLSYINTATQKMSRSQVLDPDRDPHPAQPYVMSHPSFALQWDDGRVLLIDVGMTREGALSFGKPIETLGASPIQPLTSAAETLGARCSKVQGVIFTHLHSDHVGGLEELCRCSGHPISIFMSPTQANVTNHTTSGGLDAVHRSGCGQVVQLEGDGPLWSVPGFDGVSLVRAGGHTPGSQVIVARVGQDRYAFAGDLINNVEGFLYDIPKPYLYSLLIVPEDRSQLQSWRGLLKQLNDHGYRVVSSHDQLAIEAAGLAALTNR